MGRRLESKVQFMEPGIEMDGRGIEGGIENDVGRD